MTEAEVLQSILLAWGAHPRLRGARINSGSGRPPHSKRLVKFVPKGVADTVWIAAPTGRLVMLETKRLKGARRKSQLIMQRVIRSMGGVYEFVESLAEADAVFAKLGITR